MTEIGKKEEQDKCAVKSMNADKDSLILSVKHNSELAVDGTCLDSFYNSNYGRASPVLCRLQCFHV